MRLRPYLQVDDILFTATADAIRAQRGPPLRAQRNPVALNELDYGDVVYRFQDSGRLEEVTQRTPVLYLLEDSEVIDVPLAGLAKFVRARDAQCFERAGFLVSPRHGLAFVPGEPGWVTALAAHCIDTWRAL